MNDQRILKIENSKKFLKILTNNGEMSNSNKSSNIKELGNISLGLGLSDVGSQSHQMKGIIQDEYKKFEWGKRVGEQYNISRTSQNRGYSTCT